MCQVDSPGVGAQHVRGHWRQGDGLCELWRRPQRRHGAVQGQERGEGLRGHRHMGSGLGFLRRPQQRVWRRTPPQYLTALSAFHDELVSKWVLTVRQPHRDRETERFLFF